MKKIYLALLLPFAAGVAQAQEDMNFEASGLGAGYTWNVFENETNPPLEFIANPAPGGINTSATVAKFTAMVGGQPYAGTETSHTAGMPDFVLDAAHSSIKIMVYKSVISPVGIKLVTPTGAALPEIKVSNTLINQWEELTFNFSSQVGAFTEPFDQIVVFPDFVNGPRPATNVIYFDNIVFGVNDNPPATEPMTAAPNPTLPQTQVMSLFSGVYNNVPVDTFLTPWSSAAMTEVQIQGNATKKYSNLVFAGIETVAQPLDVTDMTHFNLNVWGADFTEFKIKLVDFGANAAFGGGDDVEHELTFNAPVTGQWITYHIPLSDFTGLVTKEHIAQYIIVSNNKTVFVDNIYFSNESVVVNPTQPMTAAPDPTMPSSQVISLFSNVYTNIPMATWHTDWSMATLEDVMIQGNDTKKYSNLNFVGAEPVAQINATDMTHFNLDVWSADFTQFRVKLVDLGPNGTYEGPGVGDDKEHELTFEGPAQGEWITYHLPLSDFTNLTTRGNIAQLIFASNGTSTVFVDNVYFSTDATAGIENLVAGKVILYPNPANDVLSIKGVSQIQEVVIYNTLGQQVLALNPNAAEVSVNISHLQSGIYMISTSADGIVSTQKFIKK